MTTTIAMTPNTAAYKQTSIYKHLDLLEHLIEDGAGVWKFKLINADQFLEVLDKARARLPEELREATDVLQQRDDIVAESQRRAETVIATARRQAETMLHESELLKAVQAEVERIRKQVVQEVEQMRREALAEAERIRAEAEEDAARTREGADVYADQVLTRLDEDLAGISRIITESQNIVKNGQRVLTQVKRHGGLSSANLNASASINMNPSTLSSPLLSREPQLPPQV